MVRIYRVKEDKVEILFDQDEDFRVGQNLVLKEGGRGIITQIVELRTAPQEPASFGSLDTSLPKDLDLRLALGKVRKRWPEWEEWDGWIPGRKAKVEQISPSELAKRSFPHLGNPLDLGKNQSGHRFIVEGRALEKINIITGAKGSGKSHLAKVILLRLIELGAPCIVFDINREYIHLPGKVIHLDVGESFKLGIEDFGLGPLLTMLSRFDLPEASLMYFENRLTKLLKEAKELRRMGRRSPFMGIDELIQMADEGEFYQERWAEGSSVVNRTIRSRLEQIRETGIFAKGRDEASSFHECYRKIEDGGALILDISRLSNRARSGFVQAMIGQIRKMAEAQEERFPFLFFEEAHLYVASRTIGFLVSRARHLGITLFFVTNMISGLDESVLRQADNLFLFRLPFEDDVRYVAKSAMADLETISSLIRRLKSHHCLIIGEVTNFYPTILQVDSLSGIRTGGETKYFFKPAVQLKLL